MVVRSLIAETKRSIDVVLHNSPRNWHPSIPNLQTPRTLRGTLKGTLKSNPLAALKPLSVSTEAREAPWNYSASVDLHPLGKLERRGKKARS